MGDVTVMRQSLQIMVRYTTAGILLLAFMAGGCRNEQAVVLEVRENTYQPVENIEEYRICTIEDIIATEPREDDYRLSNESGMDTIDAADLYISKPNRRFNSDIFAAVYRSNPASTGHRDVGEIDIYKNKQGKLREVEIRKELDELTSIAVDNGARYVAVGYREIEGVEGSACGMWIIDGAEAYNRIFVSPEVPDGVAARAVFPLVIEDDGVHSLVTTVDTKAYYFVCGVTGGLKHMFKLPEAQYDLPPTAHAMPGPGEKRYMLGTINGFVAVSPESEGAIITELSAPCYTVGIVGGDSPYVVWMSFNGEKDYTELWRHNLTSGKNTPVFRVAKNLRPSVMKTTALLSDKHALLIALDGDIWRYDMRVGLAGKMWDTPDVNEILVWAM